MTMCLFTVVSSEDCPSGNATAECNYEACTDSYIVACVQGVCTCNTHGKGELIMKRVRTPI